MRSCKWLFLPSDSQPLTSRLQSYRDALYNKTSWGENPDLKNSCTAEFGCLCLNVTSSSFPSASLMSLCPKCASISINTISAVLWFPLSFGQHGCLLTIPRIRAENPVVFSIFCAEQLLKARQQSSNMQHWFCSHPCCGFTADRPPSNITQWAKNISAVYLQNTSLLYGIHIQALLQCNTLTLLLFFVWHK